MLRVTIDLVPGGFEPGRRTIASMQIANVSDLADVSDYAIAVVEAANALAGTPSRSGTCLVAGHDRRAPVWALLAKAAQAALEVDYFEL